MGRYLIVGIDWVINLIQNDLDRINDWISKLKVKVTFATSLLHRHWGDSTIDSIQCWVSTLRDLWCIVGEEEVKVCLCVRVAIFEDAHLVARVCGVVGLRDVVDVGNASWSNYVVTVAEIGGRVVAWHWGRMRLLNRWTSMS